MPFKVPNAKDFPWDLTVSLPDAVANLKTGLLD